MMNILPVDAKVLIEQGAVTVLDVRELWEYEHCRLQDALHIPLRVLPVRLNELDARAPILVYCHHGARSVFACSVLERAGFSNVYNLYGGINHWSDTVDQSIKKY